MKRFAVPLLVLFFSVSFLFPRPVLGAYASGDEYAPLGKITLPPWLTWTKAHPGVSGINLLLNNAIRLIFIIASVGLFFMFLWGGVNYIFSQGDKARTETARNMITYALIGFTIVALSFALMRLIETFFGISIVGPPPRTAARCIKPYPGDPIDCQNECPGCSISQEAGFDRMCCPPAPSGCDLTGCIAWTESATECNVAHGSECFVQGPLGNRSCCHP